MPLKGAKKGAANNKKYYTNNKAERISGIKKEAYQEYLEL